MRERLRAFWTMVSMAFHAAPGLAVGTFCLTAVSSLSTPAYAVGLKVLADAAVARDAGGVACAAAILGGAWMVSFVAAASGVVVMRMTMEERTRLYIERRVVRVAAGIPGLEHHEHPEFLNEMALLEQERGNLAQPAGPLVFMFDVLVRATASLTLLGRLHPALLLLPLFGIPSIAASLLAEKIKRTANERVIDTNRLEWNVFWYGTMRHAGDEARIFGLGAELLRRERRLTGEVQASQARAGFIAVSIHSVGWLLFALGYVGAIVFVALRAVRGLATVGDVLLTLNLAAQINGIVAATASNASWLQRVMRAVRRYLWLSDYAVSSSRRPASPAPVPWALRDGIRLEGVSFRYPETDDDVVSDVSLDLPAGTTVALVGDNGAGKTTLVKLLCGFYVPTSGRILADGIDLCDMDVEAWRDRTSAGFQDFARLELIARETVGVGLLEHAGSDGHVRGALERAGAADLVEALPDGLETLVGKSFDGGVEPSGGQWQKLAIGRAMMRESPLLLVLDEPTAALDAHTEHALFERYAGAAQRSGSGITLLVSHRFSTVKMADLIVVMDAGRVVEVGRHEDLVRADGLYAELYGLQARAYR